MLYEDICFKCYGNGWLPETEQPNKENEVMVFKKIICGVCNGTGTVILAG